MNSSLQCVLNVPRFTHSVLRQSLSPQTDSLKSLLLAKTFFGEKEVQEALENILLKLRNSSKLFAKASVQEDCEEFLTFLFSGIRTETTLARVTLLKPAERSSFVDEIFEIALTEIIRCSK
jgi:ubiquitin C-terminal hydrolase